MKNPLLNTYIRQKDKKIKKSKNTLTTCTRITNLKIIWWKDNMTSLTRVTVTQIIENLVTNSTLTCVHAT